MDPVAIGNCIWITWDENHVDGNIIDVGPQFIHCRVSFKALHESIDVSIVYDAMMPLVEGTNGLF